MPGVTIRILVTGSREWDQWAKANYCEVEVHPYLSEYGKSGGPIRNEKMVSLGADLCLAFPTARSVGTWDCIKRANRAGIAVRIIAERQKPSAG